MSISSRPRAQEQKSPMLVGRVRHASRGFWVQSETVAVKDGAQTGGGGWGLSWTEEQETGERNCSVDAWWLWACVEVDAKLLNGCLQNLGVAREGTSVQTIIMKASCSIESMTYRVGK